MLNRADLSWLWDIPEDEIESQLSIVGRIPANYPKVDSTALFANQVKRRDDRALLIR